MHTIVALARLAPLILAAGAVTFTCDGIPDVICEDLTAKFRSCRGAVDNFCDSTQPTAENRLTATICPIQLLHDPMAQSACTATDTQ